MNLENSGIESEITEWVERKCRLGVSVAGKAD